MPDRWADRIRLVDDAAGTAEEFKDSWKAPLPDKFQVKDTDKTAAELDLINECISILNVFRVKLCGLPEISYSTDRVHMLAEDEFWNKIFSARFRNLHRSRKGQIIGKSNWGRVYLRHGFAPNAFAALFLHELFHATSYLWLDFRQKVFKTDDGLILPKVLMRRHGMILIDPSYHTLLPHFHGLNEATSEFASMVMRKLMSQKTQLMDEQAKQWLENFSIYHPLLHLFEHLIFVAAGSKANTQDIYVQMFTDCLTGTDNFLSALEKNMPGATEVLRRTGAQPHEVLRAAEELKLPEQAKFIKQYIKKYC